MADTTRNLGLPLLAAGQAQKHVTHNEALTALDALVQLAVRSRTAGTPPASPAEGERHIVGPAPTGAWGAQADRVAVRLDGAWTFFMPRLGWLAYVEDEAVIVSWSGSAWIPFGETAAALLAKLLTIDGDGSGLDADLFGGTRNETYAALMAMQTMMTGGGTLSVSSTFEVRWSARIIAMGFGRGAHWGTSGYFDVAMPAVGASVPGVGGAASKTVTAGGIPLAAWEALYYAVPVGAGFPSVPGNFRVVGYTAAFEVPATWICLCARNGDMADVTFWNGLKLGAGQSYDRATSTAARPKLTGLGIGTDSDAANALAVASAAILFSHAGAGMQAKANKAAASDTASLLFQTAFSGRAEFGTLGSDNVSLKVSPDGSAWFNAFSVDRATGQVSFDAGSLREEIVVFTASGTWAKPAWAKMVTVFAMGGGGGGGSGRRGAASSVRGGGGGGAAGALTWEEYAADELPATLTITIGAGGAGGGGATADATNGAAGGIGGTTTVANGSSSLLIAAGGGAGAAGSTAGGAGGAAGQGQSMAGVGAGGAGSVGATAAAGGNGIQGGGGGGGGGGLSAADAAAAGGASGHGYLIGGVQRRAASVAAGGVGLGGNAGTAKAWTRGAAAGGGGGGAGPADASGAGGAGGTGGLPGGGGGGGGGSSNGAPSGAGGAGGRGEVWIICRG